MPPFLPLLGGGRRRYSGDKKQPDAINEIIAGRQRQVAVLKEPVPVYILYRTAFVNPEDNLLYFYEDVYGRDTLLAKALFAS